jgi:hypothetical protein
MGYENTGKVWDVPSFKQFLQTQDLSWASGITIHHTASPSLDQRPQGWKVQHMRNLRDYYKNKLGWSAGPHLFTDEDQVFGLSSLEKRGVHARSFNKTHIGIEVLGDYDNEDPTTGRGFDCWRNTALVTKALLEAALLDQDAINFHRDDPKTSKSCPGDLVNEVWFKSLMGAPPVPSDRVLPPDNQEDREDAPEFLAEPVVDAIRWQLSKLGSEDENPQTAIEAIEWQVKKLREGLL